MFRMPYYICGLVLLVIGAATVYAEDKAASPSVDKEQQELERALQILNARISDTPSVDHHRRAGILFRMGRFEEAIADYTTAIKGATPHSDITCWERGLAYYYVGDFRKAEAQFTCYHEYGALDIENGLWRLMCMKKEEGLEKARAAMITYSEKKRPPFPALLDFYMGKGSTESIIQEATEGVSDPNRLRNNLFYAHYYIGKYYEMVDKEELALSHIQTALSHRITHFMYACAQEDVRRLKVKVKEE